MNDDFASEPLSTAEPARRRTRLLVPALLVILLLAGAATLWVAARGGWLSLQGWQAPVREAGPPPAAPPPQQVAIVPPNLQDDSLAVRLTELEQRVVQLGSQGDAMAENAARAEGLMIAFAVRRAIERGLPLGYLEGQLKLRFGDAQPNSVATLIEASSKPVTREQLAQSLEQLAPALVDLPPSDGTWERMRREVANLFVIRKASAPSPQPERRLDRARSLLQIGRVDGALAEVQRLPGRSVAGQWVEMAQRYIMTERALDLIETAALLEPRPKEASAAEPVPAPATALPQPPAPEQPGSSPPALEPSLQTG